MFFWIAASVVDSAAVNPNGIKALLESAVSRLMINVKQL